jgi:arginyl-tRNA synthetase
MKAAVMCLGHQPEDLEIIIGQNVALVRNGEEVRMSKRSGDIIELAEIIDEVGPDVAKLSFLLQSVDTRQTVDLATLVDSKLDNPVHYIHYAHARVYGIGRKADELGVQRRGLADADLALLAAEQELDLLRSLASLPDVVALAATERAPHKVTTWLRELAGAFQSFYAHCPVLASTVPADLQQARLWLVEAARIGLSVGLSLLGVSAPERMDDLAENAS